MSLEDLTTVLSHYPAIARPLDEPVALGNAGGHSGGRLWRFDSGLGLLVARAWPLDGIDEPGLKQIHEWLGMASSLDFIPVPIRDRTGRTFHSQGGRLWDVSPWLPGAPELATPPSTARLRSGFKALGSLHQALAGPSQSGHSPGLAQRVAEIQTLMLGGFDVMEAAILRAPAAPITSDALRWLRVARRVAPLALERLKKAAGVRCRLQPCLRDVRPDHLLFEEGQARVVGLIDFGAMRIDVVAGDLARLLSEWVEGDRWARGQALEAYASVRPLSDAEGSLIAAFESSANLLAAGHWIRWHFLEGRIFEDPSAVDRGISRSLERLIREVTAELP